MSLAQVMTHLKTARQRAVFLFSGHESWCQQQRQQLLNQQQPQVYLSDGNTSATSVNRYRDYLGQSNLFVVLEFQQLIHADALAALAGTVSAGGLLCVFLPVLETPFKRRLIASAPLASNIQIITPTHPLEQACSHLLQIQYPAPVNLDFPTAEQQKIVKGITASKDHCHLIMADRGRGKSTALGLACRLYKQQHPTADLIVTGPTPAAVATVLEHAQHGVRFAPWDKLLQLPECAQSVLVIDEAAALPMHVLKALTHRFQVIAIATTIDGYEGCGRGFALRFIDWIQAQKQTITHQLSMPVRWSALDGCEAWLNHALLMKLPLLEPPQLLGSVTYREVHASDLNEHELAQIMALLLEAHYQSSPNDLRLLLDDPLQRLLLAFSDDHIAGVVWYSTEGAIAKELHPAILAGERRLKGHLLPQLLSFYYQQNMLGWRWWRITRIAVPAALRRNKVGLELLKVLARLAHEKQVDALGSSFGAEANVLKFWKQSEFEIIRVGQKLNMASGFANAIVAAGLSRQSLEILHQIKLFSRAQEDWRKQHCHHNSESLNQCARAILKAFAYHHLPFSEAQFAWVICEERQSAEALGLTLPKQTLAVASNLALIARDNGCSSQKEQQEKLRKLAREYLELSA